MGQIYLEDHITLYFDLLGFAEAVCSADESRLQELGSILQWLADNKRLFEIDGMRQADGSYKIKYSPTITSFSDHVVVSYPISALIFNSETDKNVTFLKHDFNIEVLRHFQMIVATVALAAVKIGFLVRGAITVGRLFHNLDVIIGPALVEAYMLESVKAKGPRIIVSEKILETLVDETKCPILTDQDGWKHLDYFSRMLLIEEERVGRSEAKSSLAKMISLSDSKEKELSLVGSNGAPKWSAFKKYIEEEVARYF